MMNQLSTRVEGKPLDSERCGPGKELKDMNCEKYKFYRKELEEQKRQIRNGYQRLILVVLYLATVQLSPSAPNSIIAIALGTRLCM